MQSAVGQAAGASAGATEKRLAAYLSVLEPKKEAMGREVAIREMDIAKRAQLPSQQVAEGKKDCFITTACVTARGLPDDCTELRELRAFRDGFMRSRDDGPAEIAEYYRIAPSIVASIDADPHRCALYDELYEKLVRRSLTLIRDGRLEEALAHYRTTVIELKDLYLRG